MEACKLNIHVNGDRVSETVFPDYVAMMDAPAEPYPMPLGSNAPMPVLTAQEYAAATLRAQMPLSG